MLAALLLLGPPAASQPATSPELLDYLIQDVCIDARGAPTSGDPAVCKAHRNIAVGEASPYLLTDFDRGAGGLTYSAMNSFPVRAPDGALMVMVAKSNQHGFAGNFHFAFKESRDGFDLIDTQHAGYVSIIRTSDGGCFDQMFSRGPGQATQSDRAGGWILFPRTAPSSWPASSSVETTTYHIQLTPGRPGCGAGHSLGRTFWNRPAPYRFETGKTLIAIRSDHFASNDLSRANNALERCYFTRQYGFTRWEAWVPEARCFKQHGDTAPICHPESPDYPLKGRCSILKASASSYPGLDSWGLQTWVRVDCRDQTNHIALATPQRLLDPAMGRSNGVIDVAAATP